MILGISPPSTIVVKQTNPRVVLLITETWLALVALGSIVSIKAKATEPLMVPPTATMDSYLLVIVHFLMILRQMVESPKMVMILATMTMASSSPRNENEMASLRK